MIEGLGATSPLAGDEPRGWRQALESRFEQERRLFERLVGTANRLRIVRSLVLISGGFRDNATGSLAFANPGINNPTAYSGHRIALVRLSNTAQSGFAFLFYADEDIDLDQDVAALLLTALTASPDGNPVEILWTMSFCQPGQTTNSATGLRTYTPPAGLRFAIPATGYASGSFLPIAIPNFIPAGQLRRGDLVRGVIYRNGGAGNVYDTSGVTLDVIECYLAAMQETA